MNRAIGMASAPCLLAGAKSRSSWPVGAGLGRRDRRAPQHPVDQLIREGWAIEVTIGGEMRVIAVEDAGRYRSWAPAEPVAESHPARSRRGRAPPTD